MDVNTGYGIFRLLKARVDLGHGGKDGRIFFYVLYDRKEVRLFHALYVENSDPDFSRYGVKMGWRDFRSFIDEGSSEKYNSEVNFMVSDLSEVFKEIGVYDLKEDNMTKIRGLEKTFSRRTGQFYDGQVVSFIKLDAMTVAEAQSLLDCFSQEVVPEDACEGEESSLDDDDKAENGSPLAVVPCSIVMDPLRGIPVSSIVPGDIVTLVIPETSFIYKNMRAQDGDEFTGQVERIVQSVRESDSDRVVMEFDLFDDVAAVSVAQKSLKIRASSQRPVNTDNIRRFLTPSNAIIVAGVCLVALFILVYRVLV